MRAIWCQTPWRSRKVSPRNRRGLVLRRVFRAAENLTGTGVKKTRPVWQFANHFQQSERTESRDPAGGFDFFKTLPTWLGREVIHLSGADCSNERVRISIIEVAG